MGFDVLGAVAADPGVDFEFVPDAAAEELVDGYAEVAGFRFLLVTAPLGKWVLEYGSKGVLVEDDMCERVEKLTL